MKCCYSTDLTDAEWECLEPHVPPPNKRGRPKTHTTPEILNAIFYVLKSGCAWRLLPRDFPPWETVYWWFRRWRIDGTFERLNGLSQNRRMSRDYERLCATGEAFVDVAITRLMVRRLARA